MTVAALDEILELERRSVAEGDERSERGRDLLTRAATLRLAALETKSYPSLTCSACIRVTGWLGVGGRCDDCTRHALTRSAFADPHGGWVSLASEPEVSASEPHERHSRPAIGPGARKRRQAEAWLRLVDPDVNGPIEPTDGYAVEVARRQSLVAADGSSVVLIRFSSTSLRFAHDQWLDEGRPTLSSRSFLTPTEFAGTLPVEQLAEAWGDYSNEIHLANRDRWGLASDRNREAESERALREDALRQQAHVAELLEEER